MGDEEMKVLKSNLFFRIVEKDDGDIEVQHFDQFTGGYVCYNSVPFLVTDYINELLETIEDMRNELIEYGEFE